MKVNALQEISNELFLLISGSLNKKGCGIIHIFYYLIAGVRFQAGAGIFLFAITSWPALETTQPPIQCLPEALSPGAKLLGREADHSP